MKHSVYILLISLICMRIECKISPKEDALNTNEAEGVEYLANVDKQLAVEMNKYSEAQWAYATNINDQTSEAQTKASEAFNAFQKNQSIETKKFNWTNFAEYNRRQFEKLSIIGTSALVGEDETTYLRVSNEMDTTYSSAKVCVNGQCDLELDPDLDRIMATSKNYAELEEAWVNWRDASGKKMRQNYITYYTLGNKAATLNKLPNKEFKTLDDLWLFPWETPDIKDQAAKLMEQILPFYKKIHAYVRIQLEKQYKDKVPSDRTIPAHLLGNMWAQQWSNILNTVAGVDPYPQDKPIDVTDELVKQNYNSTRMFQLSDKFFGDLGLQTMNDNFWEKSVIDKIPNVVMVCHASAWDFYTKDDFRIKQCTNIDMEDLITIHHEMGHIEYDMNYKDQPVVYREGANPGFHEAIGDLLALSVSTPKHLKNIGLLDMDLSGDQMDRINLKFQLKMALDKVAFLPFAYIMDKWRWDVFSGTVSSKDLNRHWWQLRGDFQGLSPPVKRSEQDFDPGAKYHIPASVEYIRYFASHILQFQFHKALCSFSQKDVPLYECDIDGDKEAGNLLKQVLTLGSSKKWPEQLKLMTGSEVMDVQPLLDYFQPLIAYLDKQLEGQTLGWSFKIDDYFTPASSSAFQSSKVINILSLIMSVFISFTFIIM